MKKDEKGQFSSNKNTIFEGTQGFPKENWCPFKNVVFVRKPQIKILFKTKKKLFETKNANLLSWLLLQKNLFFVKHFLK
jgi:hypothetical protein